MHARNQPRRQSHGRQFRSRNKANASAAHVTRDQVKSTNDSRIQYSTTCARSFPSINHARGTQATPLLFSLPNILYTITKQAENALLPQNPRAQHRQQMPQLKVPPSHALAINSCSLACSAAINGCSLACSAATNGCAASPRRYMMPRMCKAQRGCHKWLPVLSILHSTWRLRGSACQWPPPLIEPPPGNSAQVRKGALLCSVYGAQGHGVWGR